MTASQTAAPMPHERRGIHLHPCPVIEMNPRPRIIGLAGRAGAGKDTVAALLRMRGYQRLAFGDALRDEVIEAVERRTYPDRLESEQPFIAAIIRSGAGTRASIAIRPYLSWVRALLQWWGTEYRRSQDPIYWVQRLAESIRLDGYYAISDVRFADEAEFVRSMGGRIWMITGRAPEASGEHASEQLVGIEPDTTIDNSGTPYQLAERVANALKTL